MVDVGGGGALAVVKFGVCAVVEFDVELRLKGISAHVGPPRPPPPPPTRWCRCDGARDYWREEGRWHPSVSGCDFIGAGMGLESHVPVTCVPWMMTGCFVLSQVRITR